MDMGLTLLSPDAVGQANEQGGAVKNDKQILYLQNSLI